MAEHSARRRRVGYSVSTVAPYLRSSRENVSTGNRYGSVVKEIGTASGTNRQQVIGLSRLAESAKDYVQKTVHLWELGA